MVTNNMNQGMAESPIYSQALQPKRPEYNSAAVEFNFFDLLTIAKRQWGLIFFGILFCVALGILYYAQTERLYQSAAQLFILERNASAALDPGAASYYSNVQDSLLSSHIMIIQSSENIEKAYQALRKEKIAGLDNLFLQENPVGYIKSNLKTTKGGEGKLKTAMVMTVAFRSPIPEESEAVLSAVINSYMNYVQEEYSDSTQKIAELHRESRVSLEAQLEELQVNMADFLKKHPDYLALSSGSTTTQHLLQKCLDEHQTLSLRYNELKAQMSTLEKASESAAQENEKLQNSEVVGAILAYFQNSQGTFNNDNMKELIQGSFYTPNSETQKMMEIYRSRISTTFSALLDKELKLNVLEKGVAGQESPELRQLRADIVLLNQKIEEIQQEGTDKAVVPKVGSDSDLLKTLKVSTRESIAGIETRLANTQKNIDELNAKLVEQGSLKLEYENYESQRARIDDAVNRAISKLIDIDKVESSVGLNVKAIEKPQLAKRPVWPNLVMVIGLAGIAGIAFGCALAYLVDLTDRTFHSPMEVGNMIAAPVLTQLPKLHSIHRKQKWLRPSKKLGAIASEIVTYHNPKSLATETFRGLRTSLLVGMKMQTQTALMVTSTNPHDGKTTVATNLAVSIANSNRRVLLVDADLRSPNLHSIFGIANGTGLSNFLHEEKQFDDILLTSPVDNLTLITAGTNCKDPAEVLSSPLFKKFLELAKEKFDYVIIDTPPVLAVSDTCIMASEVDGVLMTVRIIKNGRPSVMHAAHLLREVGANICGLAINTFRSHRFYHASGSSSEKYGYGYGYGYGATYGYGYGHDSGVDSDEKTVRKSQKTSAAS